MEWVQNTDVPSEARMISASSSYITLLVWSLILAARVFPRFLKGLGIPIGRVGLPQQGAALHLTAAWIFAPTRGPWQRAGLSNFWNVGMVVLK